MTKMKSMQEWKWRKAKKREHVKEKRERERDITLVSEQHTKNRLKVNIAGLCTVQSTVVCRNSVNVGATSERSLRQGSTPQCRGVSEG